jgi:hypothetical protein
MPLGGCISKGELVLDEEREEADQKGKICERPEEELHARSIARRVPRRMTIP